MAASRLRAIENLVLGFLIVVFTDLRQEVADTDRGSSSPNRKMSRSGTADRCSPKRARPPSSATSRPTTPSTPEGGYFCVALYTSVASHLTI